MSNELIFKPTQAQANQLKVMGMVEEDRREFLTSLGTLILNNEAIANCDRNSVFNVVLQLRKLNLNQETGTGWVVPYKNNKLNKTVAQMQIGYKGYVELAMRTGLYNKIDCVEVKESDYVDYNIDTDTYTWREDSLTFKEVLDRKKEETIGYRAFAILKDGTKIEEFWTMEQIIEHHTKFSQAYKYKDNYGNVFKNNQVAMDKKVVLKNFINRKLVKSLDTSTKEAQDLLEAKKYDSSAIDENKNPIYIDNPTSDINLYGETKQEDHSPTPLHQQDNGEEFVEILD